MLTFVLVLVVTMIVLSQVGVHVAPLIAGAGVVGVAIGFGSQKLVQDVITGAFILFEDTLAVGDTVTIGDHSGVVEGMTVRTIRLRSGTGELHTLPFSSVTTVINQSRGFAIFPFTIGVAYREDIDRAMEVMRRSARSCVPTRPGAPRWRRRSRFRHRQVRRSRGDRQRPDPDRPRGAGDGGPRIFPPAQKRFDELGIVLPHTVYIGADGKPRVAASTIDPAATPKSAAPPA